MDATQTPTTGAASRTRMKHPTWSRQATVHQGPPSALAPAPRSPERDRHLFWGEACETGELPLNDWVSRIYVDASRLPLPSGHIVIRSSRRNTNEPLAVEAPGVGLHPPTEAE